MQHSPKSSKPAAQLRLAALTLIAAAALAACGGGGGNPGAVGPNNPSGNTGGNGGAGTGTVTTSTKVTVALVDGAGNSVGSLSGGQSASLKATVLGPDGKPAARAIVQFATSSSELLAFTPGTASALTDANGVAVVTVKPASYTAAGAAALSATSVVEGKTGTAGVNIAIGAAPLTVGALSFTPALGGALPAFNTVALRIPVTSGGQPVSVAPGLTLTSDCVGDGTATLVPGTLSNGVQLATYTNKGCTRGTDTITASIGTSSESISLPVSAANIGSIQFANSSANGNSIVLKGSGGLGRSESAQLTFRVVDQQNNGLGGVDVDFAATTNTGGLSVSPVRATTDANGNVSTMVSSGTIPTPVRVMATASRNGQLISGLSDTLIVSTGLPIQRSMSLSADHYNIEGSDVDGETVGISVRLADQYRHLVSDGTAVTFVAESGAIGSSAQGGCTTVEGECSVKLITQGQRPADGRVTVLAFVQGVEDFTDVNGDGQYSCTNYEGAPAPYRPLVDRCLSGGEVEFNAATQDMGDPFLDVDGDGVYDGAKGDLPFPYGHTGYRKEGDGKWGLNYLRESIEVVFSGSEAQIAEICQNGSCSGTLHSAGAVIAVPGAAGSSCQPTQLQNLSVRLTDRRNNPLPFGTTVTVSSSNKLTVGAVSPASIGSTTTPGGTVHLMTVTPEPACAPGDFTLQVKTPQGKITEFKFIAN